MWREAASRLPPNAFAFVMATGILSTALNIIGIRLYTLTFPWPTIVLALISIALLLLLTYGIPSNLILRPGRTP
jgi:tellurite resistance protein TehA-like permease